jgi:hypothetical protein
MPEYPARTLLQRQDSSGRLVLPDWWVQRHVDWVTPDMQVAYHTR